MRRSAVDAPLLARKSLKPTLLVVCLVALALTLSFLASCGGGGTTSTTGAGGQAGFKTGGTMSVAVQAPTNRDPAFSSTSPDILLNRQLYDWLVELDNNNKPQPGLATAWTSPDGKVWTFEIRPGVKFSDGSTLTTEDIVYTFNRLRDPKVGSPDVSLYANVTDVKATDATHVQFTLKDANPEFPSDVADYHAAILSHSVADPAKTAVGTGPFKLTSYVAEDRAVLAKNPDYWMKDAQGRSLPYLDTLQFIFTPDLASQVTALQGDQVQFVLGLTAELAATVKADSKLTLLTGPPNAFHYVIHMRSDAGHPASNVLLRQALQLGTDHQNLIDQVRPGLAVVGNGTPVGPAFTDYYLNQPPAYDPAKAKQLLTQAGYPNGLDITLYAQQALEVPAIATVWKAQMAKINVRVNIQTEPPDVYYGDGDGSWLKADFGITEWASRPTPVTYFNVAYVTGSAYNESHWSDPEFDALVKQINTELDLTKRVQLYHQAQTILIDRGPVIVPFFETAAAGVSTAIDGISLAPDWARTTLRTAHFTR